ncbi:MAG: hypothetical protein ABI972_20380 [Acidobacteriota bacterium]
MTDDPITPLFAHDEPGPRFTVAEASKRLEEPGVPADTLASQIRSFAQRRLVHVRGTKGSGRTAHNLYALSDLAAAKVLSVLTSDLSLSDNKVMEAVSLALYTWDADMPLPAKHANSPVLTALAHTLSDADAWWVFDLRAHRSDQTGERRFRIRLYDPRNGIPKDKPLPDEFQPRAAVTIQLRPLLIRLASDRAAAN